MWPAQAGLGPPPNDVSRSQVGLGERSGWDSGSQAEAELASFVQDEIKTTRVYRYIFQASWKENALEFSPRLSPREVGENGDFQNKPNKQNLCSEQKYTTVSYDTFHKVNRNYCQCFMKKRQGGSHPSVPKILVKLFPCLTKDKQTKRKENWRGSRKKTLKQVQLKTMYCILNRNRLRGASYGYQGGRVRGRDSLGVWDHKNTWVYLK